MSIFINTHKSHAGQSVLPISWSYRMIHKVLARLAQSQNCECLKRQHNTTHLSLASRGGRGPGRNTFPQSSRNPTRPLPSRMPPSLPLVSVPLFYFQEQWCLSKKTQYISPDKTDLILEAQHKVKMQGPSSNIIMNFKMEPSRGPSKLWPYTTTQFPAHTIILPEVSYLIWIPGQRQGAQLGCSDKNQIFFLLMVPTLMWKQVSFHIQNVRQNSISRVSDWSVVP